MADPPSRGSYGCGRKRKGPASLPALLHCIRDGELLRRSLRRFQLCRYALGLLFLDGLVALGCDVTQTRHGAAGTGRDETSDDDVLLEALERVDLAVDCGVGEDARGLLERRGREHRTCLERRLGDAQKNRTALGVLAAGF